MPFQLARTALHPAQTLLNRRAATAFAKHIHACLPKKHSTPNPQALIAASQMPELPEEQTEQSAKAAVPEPTMPNSTSEPGLKMAPDGKRKNRGQTCKDRREHAHKKLRSRNAEEAHESRSPRPPGSEPRLPKRRVALLMGFCGTGFQGMQVNPNARTIEGDLFKALVDAGAVSADNSVDQSKVQLQRAARTDKGVHAAGQVVSLKMIVEDPEIVAKINSHLPEQIRVWGFVRVIRSFNAKTMCDSRVYEYLLPTYVLMEPSAAHRAIAQTVPFEQREIPETTSEEIARRRAYRVPADKLQFVRDAFAKYKGTHDFRNFTVTRGCTDTNSRRHIHYFDVSDPMVIDGSEWLSLKVKGQSFMLHQIRKMVGLIILMARSGAPLALIDALFGGPRVNVPKAPGLGLLLEQPVFDGYNKRAATQTAGATSPVGFDDFQEQIGEFKQKLIYDAITQTEARDAVFDEWVKSTEVFPEEYTYINAEGVIPESAVVVPGAQRRVPLFMKRDAAAAARGGDSEDEADTRDD